MVLHAAAAPAAARQALVLYCERRALELGFTVATPCRPVPVGYLQL